MVGLWQRIPIQEDHDGECWGLSVLLKTHLLPGGAWERWSGYRSITGGLVLGGGAQEEAGHLGLS